MIPIPEELAKRVLEALDLGVDLAEANVAQNLKFANRASAARNFYQGAKDDFERVSATRDELAALLTPKEAT